MSVAAKTPVTVTPPVLRCRLCHCEFTNFKEHVKSLVHLDARETKSTPNPVHKHKSSHDDCEKSSKKPKIDIKKEKSTDGTINKREDTSAGSKESSLDSKADGPIKTEIVEYSSSAKEEKEEKKDEAAENADLNGTSTSKTDDKAESDKITESLEIVKYANEIGEELTKRETKFLNTHWHCKMCIHVHRLEDGSFDEHAHDEGHRQALELQLRSLRQNYKFREGKQWLINCLACSFHTNDKAQFISHLQTEMHDKNVKEVIGNERIAVSNDKPQNCSSEKRENKLIRKEKTKPSVTTSLPQKKSTSAPLAKAAPVQGDHTKQRNTNVKSPSNKSIPINTRGKPFEENFQGVSTAQRNVQQKTPLRTTPQPLMSLSLSKNGHERKSGWNPTAAVTRNQTSSNKPGILGEYRPDVIHNNFGFDVLTRNNPFGRPADRQDLLAHRGVGSASLTVGRPTYSEVNRSLLSATAARTFELDSLRTPFCPDRFDSVWSGQSSLASPKEKLNSAFGTAELESSSTQFDVLANLLSSQRTGTLPSTVSLDLASNSSIRFKQSSGRGALFDHYPASRPDFFRNDMPNTEFARNGFSKTDFFRQNASKSDPFSKSMYTRR